MDINPIIFNKNSNIFYLKYIENSYQQNSNLAAGTAIIDEVLHYYTAYADASTNLYALPNKVVICSIRLIFLP